MAPPLWGFLLYPLRVARLSEELIDLCRARAGQGALHTMGLKSNPKQVSAGIREEVALLPVEYGGLGIRDVRAVLLHQHIRDILAASWSRPGTLEHESWFVPLTAIRDDPHGSSYPSVRRVLREVQHYGFSLHAGLHAGLHSSFFDLDSSAASVGAQLSLDHDAKDEIDIRFVSPHLVFRVATLAESDLVLNHHNPERDLINSTVTMA